MSGRSGYRKTDRKQTRRVVEPGDYVLRFTLPPALAFATAEGTRSFGVTVGFNSLVFAQGNSPRQCAELAAAFLFKLNACAFDIRRIDASVMKLLPCSSYRTRHANGFAKLGIDLEAVHDNIQRNAHNARPCQIHVGVEDILFLRVLTRQLTVRPNGTSKL